MITEHTKLSTLKVVSPNFQGKYYSRQLQVMSEVVSLMHLKLP